jgi:putative membrane protein
LALAYTRPALELAGPAGRHQFERVRVGLMLGSLGAVLLMFSGVATGAPPDTATVLRDLHAANQMQIAAGTIAKEKGQTVQVQTFGLTLVSDHTTADRRVAALAAEENIDLSTPVPMARDQLRELTAAKGAAFDELFVMEMLEDHKKLLADVKAARDKTEDVKLKTLLEVTIPVLEAHHQIARTYVDEFVPSAIAAAAAKRTAARRATRD